MAKKEQKLKVLVIGSGGREHAIIWKINQSPLIEKIYCVPGNGGIAQLAQCVDIDILNQKELLAFVKKENIDLTIVGPEAPLVDGIVDAFEKKGHKIFGPTKKAAQLEGSKVFAKEFMHRHHIPTADFRTFDNIDAAKEYARDAQFPLVIKADGLAAGKGVIICDRAHQALEAIDQIMNQKVFKDAGNKIVIEDCLQGEEVSILAISDGGNFVILESAQDHKRIFDDDLGPNTGGMGAYSPAPIIDKELMEKIEGRVIEPTIRGMSAEGIPFRGVLYAGLMITVQGPMVLEFNTRLGDPETQAVLPRLKNDLLEIILASCEGLLDDIKLQWEKKHCVCVVMSSGGYPGNYETGKEITGLDQVSASANTIVFHAGTKKEKNKVVTSGGRVLGVTGLGRTIDEAINKAYAAVEKIKFEKCFFRRDIGEKALKRLNLEMRR